MPAQNKSHSCGHRAVVLVSRQTCQACQKVGCGVRIQTDRDSNLPWVPVNRLHKQSNNSLHNLDDGEADHQPTSPPNRLTQPCVRQAEIELNGGLSTFSPNGWNPETDSISYPGSHVPATRNHLGSPLINLITASLTPITVKLFENGCTNESVCGITHCQDTVYITLDSEENSS